MLKCEKYGAQESIKQLFKEYVQKSEHKWMYSGIAIIELNVCIP